MSLNIPEMFIIEKYVEIRFENRGHHIIFSVLEVKRSKVLQKLNKRQFLFTFFVLFFIAFLMQRLIYKINIWFNFVFGSFFEQDFLLNLIILGVYVKNDTNVYIFQHRFYHICHFFDSSYLIKIVASLSTLS